MGVPVMPSMTWATCAARARALENADDLRALLAEVENERSRGLRREFPHITGTCLQLHKVSHLIRRRIDDVSGSNLARPNLLAQRCRPAEP